MKFKQVRKYQPFGVKNSGAIVEITGKTYETKKEAMEAVSNGKVAIAPHLKVAYQEVFELVPVDEKEDTAGGE